MDSAIISSDPNYKEEKEKAKREKKAAKKAKKESTIQETGPPVVCEMDASVAGGWAHPNMVKPGVLS